MSSDPPTESVALGDRIVEVLRLEGDLAPVLFFPGGHCRAQTDCGWDLYTEAGHGVIAFSRPGYGATRVGRLGPEEFAPLVGEVCERLGVIEVAASVGVSFGGMQAVEVARCERLGVPKLVLHSCAPSVLPYPDSSAERRAAPIVFSQRTQSIVWRAVRRLVGTDAGLKMMLGQMSTLPRREVWSAFSAADRERVRHLFRTMGSDGGFVLDLAQATTEHADRRREALASVACPTLVTASPHDGGVSFEHAVSLADTIPGATLVDTEAPTHLAWIGPAAGPLGDVVAEFLHPEAEGRGSRSPI